MAIEIKIILSIITTFAALFSAVFFMLTKQKKKKKVKQEYQKKRRDLLGKLLRLKFLKKMDKVLKEAGNPLSLTIERYVFALITLMAVALYLGLRESVVNVFKIYAISFLALNSIIYLELRDRREKIKAAFCDVQEIIYFQSMIGTSTEEILAQAAKVAKEPLKSPLLEAASTFRLTRNIDEALKILVNFTEIMEIRAFYYILKQKEETGFSEENHKAQLTMLKRTKLTKRKIDRNLKRTKLILSSLMLFACYTALVAGPLLLEVRNSIDLLFR